jgi:hypothetical protein
MPRGDEPRGFFFHYAVLTTTTPTIISKPIHMTLDLTPQLKSQLDEAAHYCAIPAENLARLFVADGLRLYLESRDELKDTLDGEDR